MNKELDINNIGKRMPYTVPDDFFANVEDKVMERINVNGNGNGTRRDESQANNGNNSKKRRGIVIALRTLLAAAACLTLFFVVQTKFVKSAPADNFASVQLAFNNLSSDDQDFLIEVYEDDLLDNEE